MIAICFIACADEPITEPEERAKIPVLPDTPFDYLSAYDFPTHFTSDPQLTIIAGNFEPSENPLTNEGATLGRVLFYDQNLSIDNTISCASCHHQEEGFSDERIKSIGINQQETHRNSMGFVNHRYSRRMFWDMRTNGIENQIPIPIENPEEMGLPLEELIPKLSLLDYYPDLFSAAFGNEEITEERISFAMSQFIRSISSFNSKYDQGISMGFSNFSEIENQGRELFFSGDVLCNHCHSTQNFYSLEAMNTGLDAVYDDQGEFLSTGNESDIGEFKVPSLRNVEFTAPYMHDGRFETLEEVIAHYSTGVQAHQNLNDRLTEELMTGGTPVQLNITENEKQALIAFLKTLSEPEIFQDEKFSNPFQ